MEEQRKTNKCPKCLGNLMNYDGHIECVDCDWGKEEERKVVIPIELNEWAIKGGR